ncbi:hypothetical protein C266_16270 [Pandoraea sp. SD6-2]|nr:hypothetical protein C266_16270 [Pandoraea sp. SD6-2]
MHTKRNVFAVLQHNRPGTAACDTCRIAVVDHMRQVSQGGRQMRQVSHRIRVPIGLRSQMQQTALAAPTYRHGGFRQIKGSAARQPDTRGTS